MDFVQAPQFGEILEQGKQAAASAVKSAVSDTASSVSGQFGIKHELGANAQQQNTNQNSPRQEPTNVQDANSANDEATTEMIKDFYAPSVSPLSQKPQTQEETETQAKLTKLRQDLHQETYYNPLFAYEQKKAEHVAEVNEQEEEQKKMMELEQKKEENKLPLSVQRAQTSIEVNRGVSG